MTTSDRVQTERKEWSIVEMSESMDEAEASDEVKMIATNIERLKIKTSEASRIREWSNIGERFGKAALDSIKSIPLWNGWGGQIGDAYSKIGRTMLHTSGLEYWIVKLPFKAPVRMLSHGNLPWKRQYIL
jgi:hypothetical protein